MFPSFPVSKLGIEIELLDELPAFDYLGGKLRGGLGVGLKTELCDHTELETCRVCPRFRECEFPRSFKVHKQALSYAISGRPRGNEENLTPPFTLDLPFSFHRNFQRGDRLQFAILLVDGMCGMVETVIRALGHFGNHGIEYGRTACRFQLRRVVDLFDNNREIDFAAGATRAVSLTPLDIVKDIPFPEGQARLAVEFVTPVHVRRSKSKSTDAASQLTVYRDFFDFAMDMAERLAELWQIYDAANWLGQAEYLRWRSRLLEASRRIRTLSSDLRMTHAKRYSKYQEQSLDLDGFIGEMEFAGDFAAFRQLLVSGELFHIGGMTAFGLGYYRLRYEV